MSDKARPCTYACQRGRPLVDAEAVTVRDVRQICGRSRTASGTSRTDDGGAKMRLCWQPMARTAARQSLLGLPCVGMSTMVPTELDPNDNKLRLFLADDHESVRESLRQLINDQNDMEVVGEAADGGDALRRLSALRPAVLLVDVSMPGMNGVEVTRVVRASWPDVHVVGVSRHREQQFVDAMLDAGAAGYVLKQSPSRVLLEAIRSVATGARYIDSSLPPRRPMRPDTRTARRGDALDR